MRIRMISVAVIAVCAVLAIAGALYAERPSHQAIGFHGDQPYSGTLPDQLPAIPRGAMTITSTGEATSVLQFDDGTCEGGLGLTCAPTCFYSSVVDFDVPTQCIQAGLSIVGLTAKMNTYSGQSLVLFQSGAAPTNGRQLVAIAPAVPSNGVCPTNQGLTARFVSPGAAVINGTANFFAGLFNNGFMGRDTGSSAGRIWLATPTTGSAYGPTTLAAYGLGGNWLFRVTVEDQNCVPVELQSITIQ